MVARFLMLLIVAILSLGAVACGGGGMMGGGGQTTVDEAKALSAKLTGKYDAIKANLDGLKTNIANFGLIPPDVDMSAVDPEALKTLLLDCYNTPAAMVETAKGAADEAKSGDTKGAQAGGNALKSQYDSVASCPGASAEKIKGIAGAAPQTTVDFLVSKVNTLDTMRKDIYLMPTQITDLITEATASLTDVATIMGKAEAANQVAQANPMADKAKAQGEYDATNAEIENIKGIASKITNDFSSLPAEIPGMGAQILTDLQNFGKR
jgi:hypothetical protein